LVDRFFGALASLKEHGALTRPAQPAIDVTATPEPGPVSADTASGEPEKPDPDDVEGLL
jgi:hypothetical protein